MHAFSRLHSHHGRCRHRRRPHGLRFWRPSQALTGVFETSAAAAKCLVALLLLSPLLFQQLWLLLPPSLLQLVAHAGGPCW